MTNGDRIRQMDDEELNSLLWLWKINTLASFMEHGATEMMNAAEQAVWLKGENFRCVETRIADGFVGKHSWENPAEDGEDE